MLPSHVAAIVAAPIQIESDPVEKMLDLEAAVNAYAAAQNLMGCDLAVVTFHDPRGMRASITIPIRNWPHPEAV